MDLKTSFAFKVAFLQMNNRRYSFQKESERWSTQRTTCRTSLLPESECRYTSPRSSPLRSGSVKKHTHSSRLSLWCHLWGLSRASLKTNIFLHMWLGVRRNPLTDLKDGHDSSGKGVKVCRSVVFKDEPVKKTWRGLFSEARSASFNSNVHFYLRELR